MKKFAIFALTIFLTGYVAISASTEQTILASAAFDEGEFFEFLTTSLDNVTCTVASSIPATVFKMVGEDGPNVINEKYFDFGSVKVTASTYPYSRAQFERSTSVKSLHQISETEIAQAAFKYQDLKSQGIMLSIADVLNDTSEAVGANFYSDEKYTIENFEASDEDENYETNRSMFLTMPTRDSKYQYLASYLETNSTSSDFVPSSAVNDENDGRIHVSAIDDVAETIEEILTNNIAANLSATLGTTIDPDQIEDLEYLFNASDVNAARLDIYMTDAFCDKVRDAADDYYDAEIRTKIKVMGVVVGESTFKTQGVSWGLDDVFGPVIKFGKAVVSAPLKAAGDAGQAIEDACKGTVESAQSLGKGLVDGALGIPSTLAKATGEGMNTFTNTIGLGSNVGGALAKGGKLVGDGFSTIIGGAKSIFSSIMSFLPYLIIIGGVLLIIGVAVYAYSNKSSKNKGAKPY